MFTGKEYTKHYYIEGERVCTKIGGHFNLAPTPPNSTPIGFIYGAADVVSYDLRTMVDRGIACTEFNPDYVTMEKSIPVMYNKALIPETVLYFYHPDHLGSSSFITDAIGYATQHLQYLPFGETFVDQKAGSFDSRYKFSAKEKDDETQYSYFGARYYDADLSVWLSVDPMSDAFPSLSAYAYCGNNPINNVDRDGAFFEELKNWAIGRGWVTNGAHQFMKQVNGPMGGSSATARKATNNVTEVTYNYTNEETGKEEMKTALFASKGRNAMKYKDAYVIESKHTVRNGGYRAVTYAGQYIKVSHGMLGNNDLINHEYGHWLQWEAFGKSGLKFYWKVGIPSLLNTAFGGVMHSYHHTEVDANRRATADGYTFSNSTIYPSDYSNVAISSGLIQKIIWSDGGISKASDLMYFRRYYVRNRNFGKYNKLQSF